MRVCQSDSRSALSSLGQLRSKTSTTIPRSLTLSDTSARFASIAQSILRARSSSSACRSRDERSAAASLERAIPATRTVAGKCPTLRPSKRERRRSRRASLARAVSGLVETATRRARPNPWSRFERLRIHHRAHVKHESGAGVHAPLFPRDRERSEARSRSACFPRVASGEALRGDEWDEHP